MEQENMNNGVVVFDHSVKLKQNSKGYFIADEVSLKANSEEELLTKFDSLLPKLITRLEKLNGSDDNGN